MIFDSADLERTFDNQTLSRARSYEARNAVTNIRWSPQGDSVRANVQGSGERPYAVRLLVHDVGGRRIIESDCSCPVGDRCQHGAALALTLLERNSAAGGGASDHAVDAWIRDVRDADEAMRAGVATERLVYVLDVRHSRGLRSLQVTPYVTFANSAREPREYPFSSISGGTARFVTTLDRTIARLMSATGLLAVGQPVLPPIVAMLLDALASHGLLHWRDALAAPLAMRALERGELTWARSEDGRFVAHLETLPEATLIASTPVWYVDPASSTAGPVTLDMPAEIAAALVRSPALTPQQAQRAQIALHRVFNEHNVPVPASDVSIAIEAHEPQPVLRLVGEAGRGTGGVLFAYGEQLVPPSDPREDLRVERDGAVTVWPRDRAFEERARERLARMDFPPYGEDAWLRFLERDAPQLRRDGWRIETHPTFPFRIVEAGDEWSAEVYESGAAQWFELELGIDVGGVRISLLPVLIDALARSGFDLDADPAQLARREEPFVGRIPGGGYVALPPERVARVLATLGGLFGAGRRSATARERVRVPLLQAASLAAASGIATQWHNAPSVRAMLDDLASFATRRITLPDTFKGELRPYQHEGVAWLQTLRDHRAGGILADDMGLGKTIMLIAHVAIERAAGRLTKPVLVVSPTSVLPNWRSEIARFLPSAADAFVLTTYALLLRNVERFAEEEWSIAVLDEAQAIKNPRSKGALAATQLRADQRLALTGTPIENHLEELWSLFHYAVPGLLPERSRFSRLFRTPIEKHADAARRSALGARIKPFLLRRTKEAVEPELPEKTEIVQRIPLIGRQRDLYETVRLTMHKRVRDEVERRGLGRSRIVVLDALLKLRQICCDPRLLRLDDVSPEDVESQKLTALLEMLESLIDDGRRILLFSQFTSMLDLIKPELAKRHMPFVELRGDTLDRETPVRRFQARDVPLFLISLKAGGTGLTLTAADTVIHYDPWWNPAVERQATDRAHRIGQEQHVFTYKLIAEDTVEERILELQERKAALAAGLFEESAAATLDLNMTDIDRLFA